MGREGQTEADREIVDRCQAGDDDAFAELVRKYQQTVFNLIYHNIGFRADVEEIAQKVFSKVYFSLSKFDNRRPFFPWLYRIAVNQCYDELRRARRRRVHTFTELNIEESESIDKLVSTGDRTASTPTEEKEMHALLLRLLDQLPEQQRMAIVLRDLEDVPYDQMSAILKCSEQAARLKVFRARARLRELVEKALRRRERSRP